MKAHYVLWYEDINSIVQREFRRVFNHDVPTATSIKMWHDMFSRWIGKKTPRSPDLTPLDFFLWGYVKDKVQATPVSETFARAS